MVMDGHELQELVRLRRARGLIDRDFADPLDVPTMDGDDALFERIRTTSAAVLQESIDQP